jgi:opacity protein-like surface antigen
MKRIVFLFALVLLTPSLFAQPWRDRGYRPQRDSTVDVTPFIGYTWGGTIYSDQTSLYGQDVDLQSSANFGVAVDIPVNPNGLKVELMVNRQNTKVGNGGGLFSPRGVVGDFSQTMYHAGVLVPFAQSRTATPFFVVSAGLNSLDPQESGVSVANRFSASAGVGVKMPFTRNLSLRLEARGYYTSLGTNDRCTRCYYYDYNHDLYQGQANVGLAFRF